MKTKKSLVILTVSALLLALSFAVLSFAGDNTPGTAADPVVSKSYVDKLVEELEDKLEKESTASGDVFKAYEFAEGSVVTGEAGTEMILRAGEAVCVDETGNGIPDCTAGADVFAGNSIEKNHLLVIPRTDGRGIQMNTHGFIMIKGEFSVQ